MLNHKGVFFFFFLGKQSIFLLSNTIFNQSLRNPQWCLQGAHFFFFFHFSVTQSYLQLIRQITSHSFHSLSKEPLSIHPPAPSLSQAAWLCRRRRRCLWPGARSPARRAETDAPALPSPACGVPGPVLLIGTKSKAPCLLSPVPHLGPHLGFAQGCMWRPGWGEGAVG